MDDRLTTGGHSGSWELLERESQLASLRQYAEEARGRDGRLVLVSGEAGIGKSSLLEALQSELRDATWVWGACDGLFTPRPLAPFHDMAREVGGALHDAVREGASRDRVYDEVLTWLGAQDRLTVLVVEDVQWADDATLDLLRYLGRRLRDLPVLLLVTFRDDALGPADTLRVALGELGRPALHPPHRPAAALPRRRSDAWPRARPTAPTSCTASPAATRSSSPRCSPPATRSRPVDGARRRPGPGRGTRRRGPHRARRGRPRRAARGSGPGARPRPSTDLATFDRLVDAGLLTADGAPCASGTSCRGGPSSRRSRPTAGWPVTGRSSMRCSTRRCDDEPRMAYHAEGAGDADLVRRYAPAAAEQAAALGAHREAAAQYERALRFPLDDPRALAELYDGYADALAYVDSWSQAAEARERAIQIWHDLGDAAREGKDHRRLCAVYWRLCRGEESVAAIKRALALLEPLGRRPGAGLRLVDRGLQPLADRPRGRCRDAGSVARDGAAARRPVGAQRRAQQRRAAASSSSAATGRVRCWRRSGSLSTPAPRARPAVRTPTPTPSSSASSGSPRRSASGATASPTATSATSRRTPPACAGTAPSRWPTSGGGTTQPRSPSGCWRPRRAR